MLEALDKRAPDNVHRYIEIENVGHCPNHEAPQAVANVVKSWVGTKDRRGDQLTLVHADQRVFQEPWGETKMEERQGEDIKLNLVDWLAVTFV